MREKILEIATDMFLILGFKSVTMDDIATKMGSSKKTIYKYFKNKTDLVDCSTKFLFTRISTGIDKIHSKDKHPVAEIFEIKKFVMKNLKNETSSPQYQLQKYYPKIYGWLRDRQFKVLINSIKENLTTGIEIGVYRENINIDFTARTYLNGLNGLRDIQVYPTEYYTISDLMNNYLEYHIRGIATSKGLEELENQLKQK